MGSFTEQVAAFVAHTTANDIPAAAFDAAKQAILDTVAVSIAAAEEPITRLMHTWAAEAAKPNGSSVWGTHVTTTAAEAALANGTISHALDFDDALPSMRGHASAVIAPTLLALAEDAGANGTTLLTSFVVGVEVLGRLGRVVGNRHYNRGWHATSTLGAVGAAAAAAHLLELDEARTRCALGLAASQAAGLTRNFGTSAKPLHAGLAARAGVMSAWLAHHGASSDEQILDGDRGFLDVYSSENTSQEALQTQIDALGKPWQILDPGMNVKRWPCCFANFRAIAGLRELLARTGATVGDIEEIAVGFLPGSDDALVHTRPATGLQGKFSVEYVLAALVLDGDLTAASFTDGMVRRQDVAPLMAKVRRYALPAAGTYSGSGEVGHTDVALRASGITSSIRIDRVPGSSRWRLDANELRQKLEGCLRPTLGAEVAGQVMAAGMALDQLASIDPFVHLLRPRT